MMKISYTISLIALLLISCSNNAVRTEDTPEQAAQKATEAWMPLWDSGKYDESYDLLAENTKRNISRRQWFVYWVAVRKPLGKLKSRKLVNAEYIESLPGVPDQAGAVLEYESSFENRKSFIETFGVMREKDGTWRVDNYIIPDRP